jgi:hypothetical protein
MSIENYVKTDPADKFSREITRFYRRVIDWNEVAGNSVKDRSLHQLYQGFVVEEFEELKDAYSAGDIKQFSMELADCLVVTSMLCAVDAVIDGYDIEETLFDPRYAATDLYYSSDYGHTCFLGQIGETAKLVKSDLSTNPQSILGYFEQMAYNLDVDMAAVAHAIMDSNFSKFIDVHTAITGWGGDLAPICRKIEEQSNGRYHGVTSQEKNGYIVFRADTGKIVKPLSYNKPNVDHLFKNV